MGLDMFLEKATKNNEKEKKIILIEDHKIETINTEAMYWRKAYAIMDWFETAIGKRYTYDEGFHIHNCACYTISKEDLEQLKLWCERFVKNPEKALGEIHKSWYEERWEDYEKAQCERTIIEIEKLLKDDGIDYFIFHGWW